MSGNIWFFNTKTWQYMATLAPWPAPALADVPAEAPPP
jgi:hypothetical protein